MSEVVDPEYEVEILYLQSNSVLECSFDVPLEVERLDCRDGVESSDSGFDLDCDFDHGRYGCDWTTAKPSEYGRLGQTPFESLEELVPDHVMVVIVKISSVRISTMAW